MLLFFSLLTSSSTIAKQKISNICSPRVPIIELEQALKLAKQSINNNGKHFVDYIELKCDENKAYWNIGFRLRTYQSGHLIIKLFMDGAITTSVSKDG